MQNTSRNCYIESHFYQSYHPHMTCSSMSSPRISARTHRQLSRDTQYCLSSSCNLSPSLHSNFQGTSPSDWSIPISLTIAVPLYPRITCPAWPECKPRTQWVPWCRSARISPRTFDIQAPCESYKLWLRGRDGVKACLGESNKIYHLAGRSARGPIR